MQRRRHSERNEPRAATALAPVALQQDAELLLRWGDGDTAAGDLLIRRHFTTLHRFLRTKVASEAELEDLVQQTLLACVESRDRYRGDASFRTFMRAIAQNRLIDHYRRSRRVLSPLSTGLRDPATSPTQRYLRGEQVARIARAIADLPALLRDVLELSYWGELDAPAIAGRMGLPLSTVHNRLHRARLALREVLQP